MRHPYSWSHDGNQHDPHRILFSFIAGLSTGLGSLIAFFIKDLERTYLSLFMGFSAGIMIQISFVELLFSAVMDVGFLYANISFFLGALAIAVIDFLIPHEYEEEHRSEDVRNHQKLVRTALLVSLGIAIHNFPEGVVTLFGTIKDPDLGFMQYSQVKSGRKTMRERTEKDVT